MSDNLIAISEPDIYVQKANSLAQLCRYIDNEAGTAPSLLARKVLIFSIARHGQNAAAFHTVEYPIREFWEACGITGFRSTNYKQLFAKAAKELADRSGWVATITPNTKEPVVKLVRFLSDVEFLDDNICRIRFDPKIAPALLDLKDNYFCYLLSSALQLESNYGFALYELLHSYKNLNASLKAQLGERLNGIQEVSGCVCGQGVV